jgi:Xaa-Pro aminopeptidase
MESKTPFRPRGPAPDFRPEVHAARRARLMERLGSGAAVIPASPELLKSRDTEIRYRPSSDLHYFTGFAEPEALAVLSPTHPEHRFTLFLRPRDPDREAWAGPRVGVELAAERFGADAAFPISELGARLPELLSRAERIHYPIGGSDTLDRLVIDLVGRARKGRQRSGKGPTDLADLEVLTGPMRLIKDAGEIDRIRVAAEITAAGHIAAMERARPGVGEWELQATLEATFRSLSGSEPAFPSIVGAGENGTVLHYHANASRTREGDLVLIDAGAEWGLYAGDVTRTFPVSGRFSGAQKELYQVVLAAEEAAISAAMPGALFSDVHDAAVRILTQGMLDLGILPGQSLEEAIEAGAHKRFYMHQTSHWIGLDVHDVGPYHENGSSIPLARNMVLTVEPGIYIPAGAEGVPAAFRGIGIRIEDDVLVTEAGNEMLTRAAPVEVDEVERLVSGE